MKKIKLTVSIALLSIFTISCGNSAPKTEVPKTETATQEEHHHNEGPIVLNNGQKWIVDKDMMVHIQNMEKDVNQFNAKSANDYAALAKKIETNIDLLTSNCTMTGQAHDELHKWLLPFIDLAEQFSASKTEQEFLENFQKIKTSFTTFNTYFK